MEKVQEQRLGTADLLAERTAPPEKGPANPRVSIRPMGERSAAPLVARDQSEQYRSRWDEIQAGFVDEPRRSVEQADALVAEVMQNLARTFADERGKLENHWSKGDNVSTEDLRVALTRYRSFFSRLLSV